MTRNRPLEKWIKELESKHKQDGLVSRPQVGAALIDDEPKWQPEIPEDCFFDDYTEERFQNIMEEQMNMIKLLKKHNKPKYMANRILIVFDDLVGSSLFSGARGSYFKGVNTRHRFKGFNQGIILQAFSWSLRVTRKFQKLLEPIGVV